MTNTPFSKQVEILFQVSQDFDKFGDFIIREDLAIPLALVATLGFAHITPSGEQIISDAWNRLCSEYGVDPLGDYQSIESILAISNE
jgi:hypothetical protein